MAEEEDKDNEEQLSDFALTQAQSFLQHRNDGRAFANYLLAFKLCPQKRDKHKAEFVECLGRWAKVLKDTGRIQDLMTCRHEACLALPDSPELLNALGTDLFNLGFMDEAASYFRQALRVDPGYLVSRQNLQNLCGHIVERWHYRMLNDKARNRAYREAIQRAVAAGYDSVLDVGAGTGLLSMYAVESGARHVYGCEMSKTMYEIARDCISANQMSDDIQIIHKKSTDLSIPEDIPERVSLLVTETFDAALLGEHVLSTLSHAWDKLLNNAVPCRTKVIPQHASIYVCAVECEHIRKQNRSIYPGTRYLEFGECCFVGQAGHTGDTNNTAHTTNTDQCEPYTSHRLPDLSGGYKLLTPKLLAKHFSFDNPELVQEYNEGFSKEYNLTFTSHGQLDALAVWFDLDLDDSVTLTSDPEAGSCWEQAVFPVLPSHLQGCSASSSLLVRQGDVLHVSLGCHNNVLILKANQLDRQQKTSTTPSTSDSVKCCDPQNHKDSSQSDHSNGNNSQEEYVLPREEITKLNDLTWNQTYCQALEEVKLQVTNSGSDLSVLSIIRDMTVLPLQALKIGAKEVCIVHSDCDRFVLDSLADQNSISRQRVHMEHNLDSVEGEWTILLADVVENSGCLRQQILEDIALARMTCMPAHGLVVPNKVCVYGLMVESEDLLQDSMVTSDNNTLGIKVKDVINNFQMTHHQEICLATLKHKKLSEPFQMFTFDLNQPLEADGDIEMTFLHQDNTFAVTTCECGIMCGIVYWFDLDLSPNITYSTLDSSSHIQQGALLQREPFEVDSGMELTVHAVCKNSCMDVILSPP